MNPPNPSDPQEGGWPAPTASSSSMPPPDHASAAPSAASTVRRTSVRQVLRQQREVEEKRKFGLAPLAVDAVTHTEISPNVPQSISRAPWYYGATGPTLEHQRKHDGHRDDVLQDRVERVVVTGQATKFVPGACQNCGSRTHKTSECVRVKKKVGAVYTNQVTGKDISVVDSVSTGTAQAGTAPALPTGEPTYAQKRDRFAGNIKIDLFELYKKSDAPDGDTARPSAPGTASPSTEQGESGDARTGPAKRRRLDHDLFREQTAQHGGVETKELPKYLQNLDAVLDGTIFFDPKTGSMRGNPNVQDPTQLFQGDMKRAQTGGHDDYLETQHRFITGESKSFVDFDYDDTIRERREREAKTRHAEADKANRVESAHELLVRSLYGDSAATTSASGGSPRHGEATLQALSVTLRATAATSTAAVVAADASDSTADWRQCVESGRAQHHGHVSTFGSYFDVKAAEWGYQCCRQLGKDAAPCQ